ncbi:MAG: hypothetical protein H0X64_04995 [Gemmatimonadaceae bacterium]|nr:hypothetical protein [Gemmatimonadaceae bacterium]
MSGDPRPRERLVSRALDWFGFTHAELLRAMPAGATGAAAGLYAASRLRIPSWAGAGVHLGVLLFSAVLGFVLGMLMVRTVVHGSAKLVAGSVMPSGGTTPSQADYSREDAMLMQRDVRGALERYEAMIAADPRLVGARLRAADIHAREGNDPGRAEALFREVQRISGVAKSDDLYASNRLVDLYEGPLANTGRAMVELRRIIERYPGTRAADDARRGLATLKARHLGDGGPTASMTPE